MTPLENNEMKRIVVSLMMMLMVLIPVSAQDSDAPIDPYPSLLLCEDGQGCRHSPISGELSYEELLIVLGEPEVDGVPRNVVCSESGCGWSMLDDSDADIVFGGDGTPAGSKTITFDEDEAEGFDFTEDEVEGFDTESEGFDFTEDGFDFTEEEFGARNVTPLSGSWTSVHFAGSIDCPGAFNMEIPAGDIETATIQVSTDGRSFVALDLDPETPEITMRIYGWGQYHADYTVSTPEGDMVLNFDIVFADPGLGFGLISSDIETQGFACTIRRGFAVFHESLDLFPNA
jgi:hypothetical protein